MNVKKPYLATLSETLVISKHNLTVESKLENYTKSKTPPSNSI
jgi:hypothetical protein